jgi:hypothetical protein
MVYLLRVEPLRPLRVFFEDLRPLRVVLFPPLRGIGVGQPMPPGNDHQT